MLLSFLSRPGIQKSNKSILLGRIAALLFCVVGFPLHLVLCLLVSACDRGPGLYRSLRLGLHGEKFQIFKYRSMKVGAPHLFSRGLKMIVRDADVRLTILGKWLRRGFDELPQLWNIARGEMSWVGPRPDPDWMLPHYGDAVRTRLVIKPGLTGFAQILDSRHLPAVEGYTLDLWYLAHRTIWLDICIILATPLYLAGWHSLGMPVLRKLRRLREFEELRCRCEEDLTKAQRILADAGGQAFGLPSQTVIC